MYGRHGRGSLTRRLATHQLRARHHYSNMKFLSHRVALTQHTPCGKTDGNSTGASHVEGCVEFAPKGTEVTRHAHQRSHTVFSGLLHVESCVHCRLPVLFFSFQAPLRVVMEAILSTMGSHIFRSMLARAIQASPFDVPCFTNMNFRIRSSHSPHMKMFVPVWADWTRRGGNVPIAAHIVQTPTAEVRKERHTVSHRHCEHKNAKSQADI